MSYQRYQSALERLFCSSFHLSFVDSVSSWKVHCVCLEYRLGMGVCFETSGYEIARNMRDAGTSTLCCMVLVVLNGCNVCMHT